MREPYEILQEKIRDKLDLDWRIFKEKSFGGRGGQVHICERRALQEESSSKSRGSTQHSKFEVLRKGQSQFPKGYQSRSILDDLELNWIRKREVLRMMSRFLAWAKDEQRVHLLIMRTLIWGQFEVGGKSGVFPEFEESV